MKKIIFIFVSFTLPLCQGCDVLIDSLLEYIAYDDDLEITATGEKCVSDQNTYAIDSGSNTVYVSFTGFSNSDGTHYRPKVIISAGSELETLSGDNEINGKHSKSYSVYSNEIEIYAELRQGNNPVYYDTAQIKLTGITVR